MVHALDERLAARLDSAGLRLDVGELYDEGRPSLSDAVVAFDGGVGSGSVISDRGLVITNHHVAYGDICALSTSERDLLRTGFWARTAEEELPVEGRSVWFLRRTLDVTRQARQLRARMEAEGRWGPMSLRRLYAELERLYGGDSTLEVRCTSLWGGERYLLHFYEVYRDVRLVGCPPASVGAFGGDADNWSWPQHKGDFALYRVYADSAGRPADYSPRNRPLNPRRVLTLSRRGVREGDFTLVLGYPGRTERYAPSYAVAEKQQVENPVVVANRQLRRQLLARRMERSGEVRRAYADEYFSLSNFTDLARWENRCLQRFDVVARRAEEERRLAAWLRGDSARRAAWDDVCAELQRLYAVRRTAQRQLVNMRDYCDSSIVSIKGSEIEGEQIAVDALLAMLAQAQSEGLTSWQISAGYRSVAYQQKLFDDKVYSYRQQGMTGAQARSAARKLVAEPGCSEHHTGLAFDITVPGTSFGGTKQAKWLEEHCWEWGFILRYPADKTAITGITNEPWHFRYVGVDAAMEMHETGECLEEYVERKQSE